MNRSEENPMVQASKLVLYVLNSFGVDLSFRFRRPQSLIPRFFKFYFYLFFKINAQLFKISGKFSSVLSQIPRGKAAIKAE